MYRLFLSFLYVDRYMFKVVVFNILMVMTVLKTTVLYIDMWVMTRKGPKYQKVAPCDLWKRVTGSVTPRHIINDEFQFSIV